MKKEKLKIKYLSDGGDPMWEQEVGSLLPWFSGKGVDIGCGARSMSKDIVRVDIDKSVKPDFIASGDKLPFKDGEFDFVCSIHSFEHFEDSSGLLKEWLRVIKTGGIIGIVHPDVFYTKKQNPTVDSAGLHENPYNKHYHEHTLQTFLEQLNDWPDLPFRVVDSGVACNNWSFYVILKKI